MIRQIWPAVRRGLSWASSRLLQSIPQASARAREDHVGPAASPRDGAGLQGLANETVGAALAAAEALLDVARAKGAALTGGRREGGEQLGEREGLRAASLQRGKCDSFP